jgi:CSLREA domain-containing protein
VVNSLADPGDGTCNTSECTLREAIKDSRSSAITFAAGLAGSSIILARPGAGGGTLVIDKTLSITGPGIHVTVSRRSTDRAFRLMTVGNSGIVSLTNLDLRNGKTERNGGGLINFGKLTLRNCLVVDNTAATGGGIDNHGPLTVIHTIVERNASSPFGAGGIHNHLQKVIFTNGSVTSNQGVGIFNGGGSLEITNSYVSGNSASGIEQDWGGTTLNHVRIGNNSGGGIGNHQGDVFLVNSTLTRNSASNGGGIFNSAGGLIEVVSSTISNNSATEAGGGIYNTSGDPFGRISAVVRVTNSTISANLANVGGGIENVDDRAGVSVRVVNSTIARNRARTEGGGVHNVESGDPDNPIYVFLINSLVALNAAPTAPDVSNGAARFSLIGDGTGSGISNTNGNQVGNVSPHSSPIDPRIGPLAANGGPSRTHALLAGSPAIDAASAADCPASDQRGVTRPQGPACDIGSYEK